MGITSGSDRPGTRPSVDTDATLRKVKRAHGYVVDALTKLRREKDTPAVNKGIKDLEDASA